MRRDAVSNEWAPFLDADETILWQGRPETGLRLKPKALTTSAFGVFFLGFALFWTYMAGSAGGSGIFPMFGLPFIAIGLWLVLGTHVYDMYRRARTHYTLTSKRAFIATNVLSRKLDYYIVLPTTPVSFHPDPPASIYFAKEERQNGDGVTLEDVGFERIDDGAHVYELIRGIQKDAA